jgi:hypothetical protein
MEVQMSLFDLFSKALSAWSDAGDIKMTAEIAINQFALSSAVDTFRNLSSSYARDKSERNVTHIRATIDPIEKFLTKVAWEGWKLMDTPVDMTSSMGFEVKTMHAMWARRILFELEWMRTGGNLPPGSAPTPWRVRRETFVKQKTAFTRMAMQFEGVVRRKKQDLKRISEYKGSLHDVGYGPGMTDDQIKMIEGDLDEQSRDEAQIERQIAMFDTMAKGAAQVVENAEKIIRKGDEMESKRK